MKLLALPRTKVQLGVPLPWSIRDTNGFLLLARGQVVKSEDQLEALLQRGAFVEYEEAKAAEQSAESGHILVSESKAGAVLRVSNLFNKWDVAPQQLKSLLDETASSEDAGDRIATFVQSIAELTSQDADIALYHAVRQETVDLYFYGYNHAIQTAMLCQLMAHRLAWSASRTSCLMSAAITMNLPILELQGQLARQDVPIKESQKAQIRKHPAEASAWLQRIGISDGEWLKAVSEHHERADGSGYPLGQKDLSEMGIALRVTDVFMAKISPRAVRTPLSIKEAARQLYAEDHGGHLSSAIIKEFGVYPPGEVVRLANGELGVVMRRTASAKCPLVATITDAKGKPVVHTLKRDTSIPEYALVSSEKPPEYIARMPPERIYGFAHAK